MPPRHRGPRRTAPVWQGSDVQPRSIHLLASLSDAMFLPKIATGLQLLREHVAELDAGVNLLVESSQWRCSEAVRVIAEEEAAKFLILLDAVRCSNKDHARRVQQLVRFNQHLAKGIYARICEIRPATFGEVVGYIDHFRSDLYLDGPNDVDWIFRNEIDAAREERIYVDYIKSDEGETWYSPSSWDVVTSSFGGEKSRTVVRLVDLMARAGLADALGLRVVADVWRDFDPVADTHWQEVLRRNRETLVGLRDAGLFSSDFTPSDASYLADRWTFPLHGAGMTCIKIDVKSLRDRQEGWAWEEDQR